MLLWNIPFGPGLEHAFGLGFGLTFGLTLEFGFLLTFRLTYRLNCLVFELLLA